MKKETKNRLLAIVTAIAVTAAGMVPLSGMSVNGAVTVSIPVEKDFVIENNVNGIPDSNLYYELLRNCDTNANGYIEASEALEMTRLSLSSSLVKDLTGLHYFENLSHLEISNMNIKSLKGIEDLKYLTFLAVTDTYVEAMDGLDNLEQLQSLYVRNSCVKEISSLDTMPNLENLYLNNNQITEIKGLDSLDKLTYLNLSDNEIVEIKGLDKLTALSTLLLDGNNIIQIKGLEKLSNLTGLSLDNNQIEKIEGLSDLPNLTSVTLDGNKITKLEGLATQLTSISLSDNLLTTTEGLEKLPNLTRINLNNNQIADLTGLMSYGAVSDYEKLIRLELAGNQITDITGINQFKNLSYLYLNDNQITDVTAVSGLSNLSRLDISGNQIKEIDRVEGLTNLRILFAENNGMESVKKLEIGTESDSLILYFGNNCLKDVSGFADIASYAVDLHMNNNGIASTEEVTGLAQEKGYNSLSLTKNPLVDVSSLSGCAIGTLYLGEVTDGEADSISEESEVDTALVDYTWKHFSDVKGLGNLTVRDYLWITGTDMEDLDGIEALPYTPQYLYLNQNKLTDVSALAELEQVTNLYLNENKLTDVSALSKLSSLRSLDISKNKITSIAGLEALISLNYLYAGNNQITDISPIGTMSSLRGIHMMNNQITDISVLSELTNIQDVYFDNNQITKLPSLLNLSRLRRLDFSYNQITDITAVADYLKAQPVIDHGDAGIWINTNLSRIHFDHNNITTLPDMKDLAKMNMNLRSRTGEWEILFSDNHITQAEAVSKLPNYMLSASQVKYGGRNWFEDQWFLDVEVDEEGVIEQEEFDNLLEQNQTQGIVIRNQDGVCFGFKKGTMKDVNGKDQYHFDTDMVRDYNEIGGKFEENVDKHIKDHIGEDEFVSCVKYDYAGDLPAQTNIRFYIGTERAGEVVYYAWLLKSGGFAETQRCTVGDDGYITVAQSHCSDYIITTKDITELEVEPSEEDYETPAPATDIPTEVPTTAPTDTPTEVPTAAPTEIPTTAPTEEPTGSAVIVGDADLSGGVTLEDANLVLQKALGIGEALTGDALEAADVDGKDGVTLEDANIVLKLALGIPVELSKKAVKMQSTMLLLKKRLSI